MGWWLFPFCRRIWHLQSYGNSLKQRAKQIRNELAAAVDIISWLVGLRAIFQFGVLLILSSSYANNSLLAENVVLLWLLFANESMACVYSLLPFHKVAAMFDEVKLGASLSFGTHYTTVYAVYPILNGNEAVTQDKTQFIMLCNETRFESCLGILTDRSIFWLVFYSKTQDANTVTQEILKICHSFLLVFWV